MQDRNADENEDAMKKANETDNEKTMKKSVLQKVFNEKSKNLKCSISVAVGETYGIQYEIHE